MLQGKGVRQSTDCPTNPTTRVLGSPCARPTSFLDEVVSPRFSPFAHIRGNDALEPAWPDDASSSLHTPRKPKQLCLTFFFGDPTTTCLDEHVDEKFRLREAFPSGKGRGHPFPMTKDALLG